MNNIVRFGIGCMGLIMVTFVVVMYFGLTKTSIVTTPEGQTQEQVRHWMERNLNGAEREIVMLGKECIFEGEERRYRLAELRAKGNAGAAPAPVERYVLQSKPNGMVEYHWRLEEFITEKKNAAKTESTPERVAWLEKRWQTLLKEMGVVDAWTSPETTKPATDPLPVTPNAPSDPAR